MIGADVIILVCCGGIWILLWAFRCWARYIAKNSDICNFFTHKLVSLHNLTFSLNINTILDLIKLILFILIFFFFVCIAFIIINIWVFIIIILLLRVVLSLILIWLRLLFDYCLRRRFYSGVLLLFLAMAKRRCLYFRSVSDNNRACFGCVRWIRCRFGLKLVCLISICIVVIVVIVFIEISTLFV